MTYFKEYDPGSTRQSYERTVTKADIMLHAEQRPRAARSWRSATTPNDRSLLASLRRISKFSIRAARLSSHPHKFVQ